MKSDLSPPTLARRLGFFALIVYGIGDILGAGIYALVGKVIGISGAAAWATFLIAALAAVLTGLSYAELSARFPVAGGAAAFVRRAFPGKLPATLIGVFVLGTGLVSAATVTTAFAGYLQQLIPFPEWPAQLLLVAGMSFLSFWGIQESSRVNFVLTAVEVGGLIAVIALGLAMMSGGAVQNFAAAARADFEWSAVLGGVTIAFYAYIGFEDLSNLAEEAKDPKRDLPRAILIAISVSTVVYILVTLALLIHVPKAEIAASKTPL
ncbi:MAG: amino acid permease, partial [Deltaproteobacteria bacterium]|nr:amino acid permease [Deltaproteobacteria bacterium]